MAKARIYVESSTIERPPAFQEYAAAALSTESVQLMSLQERGLLFTMRLYCWVNQSIPRDPGLMARALGLHVDEVRDQLTDRVMTFFEPAEDDQQRLICPALVRQMVRLMDRREKQAEGGRHGAKARRAKKFSAISNPTGTPQSTNARTHVALEKSRTEKNRTALGKRGDILRPEEIEELDAFSEQRPA